MLHRCFFPVVSAAVVLFGVMLFPVLPVATGQEKPESPKWEYRAVSFGSDEKENTKKLNELSGDGWEYVGSLGGPSGMASFRRKANAGKAAAPSDDLAKLQGVWDVVITERSGGRAEPREKTWVFVGNRYFRLDGDKVVEDGIFKLDGGGKVKTIDLKSRRGEFENDPVRLGVFVLEGDEFKFLNPYGESNFGKRPAEFSTKTDDETILRVLRREKL